MTNCLTCNQKGREYCALHNTNAVYGKMGGGRAVIIPAITAQTRALINYDYIPEN